ncbi:tetratricopeptide repeat protein [Streptomyces sp. WAC 01420]|uniref:tetratricopeptide repeat protein n=1 Tax=Streptomyces sp. WAC 01420 TaxID=2203203 RepID=UPI000F89AC34|nr:tetratricopeptide repeat protein [Streptomyces sp. WAC 01420]RSM97018.1 hypothetical protein DMA10_12440 [Streptomyces sp. WAC 01420]
MSARARRSRGELIRQRAQAQFVGRRAQLSLFAENLAKDPLAEADPADFLFHVRGVGGVGKSTLLRQWRAAAQRAGAVTAVVDENDVHGVPQALTALSRQLADEGGPLKGFDREAEQFRREQAAAADPVPADGAGPADGEASLASRMVAQATLGAVSLVPGAGVVTAMASPEAAAQGLDRLRGAAARGRRARAADPTALYRAFVNELDRLGGQHRWVVLFFDTWEQTGRYLDQWVRDLVQDAFGPLAPNVMIVLAGRDELSERDWAPLRTAVVDLPLDVFTEAETRALLAVRGVTEPGAVEAVLQLSMGLPLLVELLALARPETAGDIRRGGDAVDAVVERFVQWITDPHQRETVLACALVPHLNEDVFAAIAPQEGKDLWDWLCKQPFVAGHGDFKQYHAVVRASMVRHQRGHSPQRWVAAQLRLADTHAAWRAEAEQHGPRTTWWKNAEWRRHRMAETYHRLCAHPAAGLEAALEVTAHAAGQDTAVLREWTDTYEQAARDTGDPALLSWAERLQSAVHDDDPALAVLTALLTHGGMASATRAWIHTHRGRRLFIADRDEEALTELDRAIALDPRNPRAWAYRGRIHTWHDRTDQAMSDLNTALDLDPADAWALASRGQAHRQAGRHDASVTDLTTALDLDPTLGWPLAERGETHRQAGRHDEAVADFTAALALDATDAAIFAQRGLAHREAGRYDASVTDLTTALDLAPGLDWVLGSRGLAYRLAGRYDDAINDFTAAHELDPTDAWTLAQRGLAHREAGRYDASVTDLTTALDLAPGLDWVLGSRGLAYRLAGRYDDAINDFTAAHELEPANAWTLAQRGITHHEAGRHDEAISDLTAALGLDPGLDWALARRGSVHRQAGHYDQAVADLTAAHEIDPADDWTLTQRAITHRQAGHYDQAVTDLTTAHEIDPTDDWTLTQRAITHREAGHYDQAIADLTTAHEIDPANAVTLASRGTVHRLAGHCDEAIADLTAALGLDPTLDWALVSRGEAHQLAGRHDDAVADLTAALAHDPANASTLAWRGQAHLDAGRDEDAIRDFTAALDLDPALDWALASRAQAHHGAGRYDDAIADLTTAHALDPTRNWALASRGEVHRQAGRHDDAVADFTAALDLDPSDTWALVQRGIAHRQAGRHSRARNDFERAAVTEGSDPALLFERLMLETVSAGFPSCRQRWAELLHTPVTTPDDDATRAFGLFRGLLLESGDSVEPAARNFLAEGPDTDCVTDILLYLAELSGLGGDLADRARRCHGLISEHVRNEGRITLGSGQRGTP